MDNADKNKVGIIIGSIVFVIFALSNVTLLFILFNERKEIIISFKVISVISCISALLCYIIFIPIIFKSVIKSGKENICYYYFFYMIFLFLLFGLVGQYIFLDNICSIIVLLIASFIVSCCIRRKLREEKEADINYLKYSHLLVSVISTIIFSLGALWYKKLEIIHLLFFYIPLLMLQVVYKKAEIERNCNFTGDTNAVRYQNIDKDMAQMKNLINDSISITKEQRQLMENSDNKLNACVEIINKYLRNNQTDGANGGSA